MNFIRLSIFYFDYLRSLDYYKLYYMNVKELL